MLYTEADWEESTEMLASIDLWVSQTFDAPKYRHMVSGPLSSTHSLLMPCRCQSSGFRHSGLKEASSKCDNERSTTPEETLLQSLLLFDDLLRHNSGVQSGLPGKRVRECCS